MKVVDISRSYVLDALRERCRVQTFRATAVRDVASRWPLFNSIVKDQLALGVVFSVSTTQLSPDEVYSRSRRKSLGHFTWLVFPVCSSSPEHRVPTVISAIHQGRLCTQEVTFEGT